jgi:hypothetical protein
MRNLKPFGAALVAALMLAALAAVPAWAVEAPVNLSPPKITANPEQGRLEKVTSVGLWRGSPTSYTYQWQRCNATGGECANIAGATANSYEVLAADIGHALLAKVTAHNSAGEGTAASAPSAAVLSAPEIIPNPSEKAGVQFIAEGMNVQFSEYKSSWECERARIVGEFISATKAKSVRVHFTNCPHIPLNFGETELLTGELEYSNRTNHEVGLLLEPTTGSVFAQHFYNGMEILGSASISLSPINKSTATFTTNWSPSVEHLSLKGVPAFEGSPFNIESGSAFSFLTSKEVEIKA